MKKLYYIIYIGILMLLLAGCQDEGMFTPESDGDEPVYVTYRVNMGDETLSRAIGDAKKVNELKVGVFQDNQLLKIFTFYKAENAEAFTNVTLPLLKQETYDLVFWAQTEENGIYSIDENFNITIDYAKYQGISLAGTEDFEAFTVVKEDVSVANPGDATITLTRPFAQLNIAASEDDIFNKVNKVSFSINEVYTKFHPLMGVSSDGVVYNQEFSYSFSDQDISDMQAITIDGANYYYLASAYLLAPEKVNLTGGLYKDTELIKELIFTELPLNANTRTNIYGDMIQQEELEPWDGVIPTECPLTQDDQNRYIIDEEADLAWLSVPSNVAGLSASTFIVTKDVLNMGDHGISSIQLPAGSTFDGNGKTIRYFANSLFGNATNITVKNLTLDNVTATSDSHVGVLVNTLTGSSTFTGISITNSSATTTNGAAGGMIGYITNKKDERLNVTISACTLTDNIVDGSLTSGVYVGRFRGYDNNETLTFSSCNESSATINGTEPYYVEGNEATWLANNDYSNYSGWLGNEEFYRGTVMYGSNRFIPCWDGKNKITPLTDGNKTKLIYSAFDLASLQGTAAGDIKLMENVDMEHDLDGASKDGVRNHIFKALSTLTKLNGNGKTIYNITIRDNYYGGFVKSESCATTFENVTFDGADIRVTHDTSEGNAYVGTLRGFAYAATTINNVHVKNGYLNGVCKIGGLCGGIFSKITCSNSTVSNYSIENYDSQIISAGFKANGEIGGLIGYITVLDANTVNEISNCTVSDNNFNCVTYSASAWDRSVAPFIGDIRTQQAGTVKINNCQILGTNTYTNASNGETASFDQHRKKTGGSFLRPTYTYYPLVGQCYNVIIIDKKGKVYIDNTQIN